MRTEKNATILADDYPWILVFFEAIKKKYLNEKNLSLASTQGSEMDRFQFRLQVKRQDSEKRPDIV